MKKLFFLMGMLSLAGLGFAQVSKQQAIQIVMDSIVGSDSTVVNVYMTPTILTDSYIIINHQDSIPSPFNSYWLFFVDDMPNCMWGHRCRYIILGGSDSIQITRKSLPPSALSTEFEEVSIVYKLTYSDIMGYPETNACDVIPAYDVNDGKYAVLFSGGGVGEDYNTFWTSLSHMYCGLIEHGFKKENIYVLSADGQNNSITNPGGLDLDGDGVRDILTMQCTTESVSLVISEIGNRIGKGDLLYVFPSTHGVAYDSLNNGAEFLMYGDDRLADTIFASLFQDINCAQIIFNISSCFSGGFADELQYINPIVNKVILTSTDSQHSYMSPYGQLLMAFYPYLSCTAFRGWHPIKNVWSCHEAPIGEKPNFISIFNNGEEINYDLVEDIGNRNGIQEVGELMHYVATYDISFGTQGFQTYNCGFIEDLLCLHGVTGNVVHTQNVEGSFHIEDTLTVADNTLTMLANTEFHLFDALLTVSEAASLYMEDSTSIIARSGDCRVLVKGNLILGNGVTFEARDGATLEIIFENDTDLTVSHATFINCDLVLPPKNIALSNCHFIGTSFLASLASSSRFEGYTVSLSDCDFIPNGKELSSAIYVKGYPHYLVQRCTVDATGQGYFNNGIAIYNSGSNMGQKMVSRNTIKGCRSTGLLLYASQGNIRLNEITDNGYGVKLLNNSNIGLFSGDCSATANTDTQYIHGNSFNEVYLTANCLPQTFKYNVIEDDDNVPFVYHDAYIGFGNAGEVPSRCAINVAYNYWGTSFVPGTHLYTNQTSGYVYEPYWTMGDCSDNVIDAAAMLSDADSLNNNEEYASAKALYMQVVENYPSTASAESALKSLLALEEYVENNYVALQNYYKNNETIAADEILSHLASSLANKCDEITENYADAIAWYEAVLTNPETNFNDSVFASIDLGNLYLKLGEGGEKGICGKLGQYKPESIRVHRMQTERALSLLPSEKSSGNKQSLFPVSELNIQVGENDSVLLSWNVPVGITEARLSWSNEDIDDVLFSPGGVVEQVGANRFEPSDLEPFVGWTIKDISFVPWTPSSQTTHYGIKIYTGNMDDLVLIYDQPTYEYVTEQWNTYSVEDSIVINEGTEYWIGGYAITSSLILGVNNGNVVPWKSDLWRTNDMSWFSLSELGLWNNVCVSATLANPKVSEAKSGNRSGEILTGYRVYRDDELIAEIPRTFQTYYTDTEFSKGIDVEYCVTAVYGEEESEPVCATATITGVVEEHENDGVTVLPNPTNGIVHIGGTTTAEVRVYNAIGQLLKTVRNANEINLKGLAQGVYMLHITDENGAVATRKLVLE